MNASNTLAAVIAALLVAIVGLHIVLEELKPVPIPPPDAIEVFEHKDIHVYAFVFEGKTYLVSSSGGLMLHK